MTTFLRMNSKKLKIVFFGTPEFAVASLDRIISAGFDVAAVVTMPDKIAGRGHKLIHSDVKKYALEKGLEILQPEKLKAPEFIERLKEINADIFVVIAFRMLPEIVWSMPPYGTFNLHASLLPKYRGAAPINRAVMNGETETGVTTFFLKHEIDTGDIIEQRSIQILPTDNAGNVHDALMELGAEMVVETLEKIEKGEVTTTPQPDGEHIPAPKIFKETCKIDWNLESENIHNQVRGLSPYPGAYTVAIDEKGEAGDIKIFETKIVKETFDGKVEPGQLFFHKEGLYVATGNGFLRIVSLQPAGKKRMDADAFMRGYKLIKFE